MKLTILETIEKFGPFWVDLMAYVDLLTKDNLNSNKWLNSMTWCANALQISSQSDENWGFHKIWPKLAFWPKFISKLIGGWIQRPDMKRLFKFQVNQMKIDNFRNNFNFGLTLWPMLTFWPMITSNVIGGWIHWPDMQILFKFQVNRMKFEDFRKFGSNWPIGLCSPLWSTKFYETAMLDCYRVGDINLWKFQINPMKIEDFRKFGPNWPFGLCLPQNQ